MDSIASLIDTARADGVLFDVDQDKIVVTVPKTKLRWRKELDARKEAIERFLLGHEVPPDVPEPWEPPIPVIRHVVPPFPVSVLPEPLRSWVAATSEATQTPPDLAGLLSLAVCAGAVARRVEVVAGRGWREPICLYVAVLLEPGNRKSAVFGSAMRPLRMIESEMIQFARPEIARLASERRCKELMLKNAEKQITTKDCPEARDTARRLAEELAVEPVPVMPKLLVDDSSAEAVENHLAAQGGRMVVAGCEGGLFDVMAGRYTNGAGNLDAFLKGHAGDDLRVDRVVRGSIVVERCCLTLAYAIQPEVIRGLAGKPSFRGRGLIGRFMYAVPVSPLGKRRINPEPVSEKIASQYDALIRRLAAIRSGDSPELLTLSPAAFDRFTAWQVEVEPMLADGAKLDSMRDWGGKLCGLTARLAAIIHLVGDDSFEPWQNPITVDAIESAIVLAQWATSHAEAMLALMADTDDAVDDAAYLLRWIQDKGLKEYSKRDAHVHGRTRFDCDPERLSAALKLLVQTHWIRIIVNDGPNGRGRPASPRYAVNPAAVAEGVSASNAEPVVTSGRTKGTL